MPLFTCASCHDSFVRQVDLNRHVQLKPSCRVGNLNSPSQNVQRRLTRSSSQCLPISQSAVGVPGIIQHGSPTSTSFPTELDMSSLPASGGSHNGSNSATGSPNDVIQDDHISDNDFTEDSSNDDVDASDVSPLYFDESSVTSQNSTETSHTLDSLDGQNLSVPMLHGENEIFDVTDEFEASSHHVHDTNTRCYFQLLHLLDSFKEPPPLETFDRVLSWATNAFAEGFDFKAVHPLRKTFLANKKKHFCMEKHVKKVEEVEVEGPLEKVKTVCFNVQYQIESLLTDKTLMQPSNLILNERNPFHVYRQKEGEPIDEILDGTWYRKTTRGYGVNDFCVPVILYTDKTGGDRKNQRFPLFPLIMSFAIFNRETRNSAKAWRHIGFVSNDEVYLTGAQNKNHVRGGPIRNFHRQLDVLLNDFFNIQANGMEYILQIGSLCKKVKLWFSICCIMGDGEMGDNITGRYKTHKDDVGRIHRMCDCPPSHAANTKHRCRIIDQRKIMELLENVHRSRRSKIKLAKIAQHECNNAFFKADFGFDKRHGVFAAQPPCLMHVVSEGIAPYLIELFMDMLTQSQKSRLDSLVSPWLRGFRQTSRSYYPTANFVKGVSGMAHVTADEKIGIVFTLALASASRTGSRIILVGETSRSTIRVSRTLLTKYLHMFEGLLAMEQTLARKVGYWSLHNVDEGQSRLQDAINILIDKLQKETPRQRGNNWNLAKVHELMKFPFFISRLGSPSNFNAAIGESLLKPMGKHYLSTVNFRRETFLEDIAERIIEQDIIRFGLNVTNVHPTSTGMISEEPGTKETQSPVKHSTKFEFTLREETYREKGRDRTRYHIMVSCRSRSKHGIPKLHSTIIDTVKTYMIQNSLDCISGYTQFQTSQGDVFKSHPNYNGDGPWYDWANVSFQRDRESNVTSARGIRTKKRRTQNRSAIEKVPCKLLLFLKIGITGNQATVNDGRTPIDENEPSYCAVMHCCTYGVRRISSLFFQRKLEYQTPRNESTPIYRVVPCSAINEPVYCFEECPGFHTCSPDDQNIIIVAPRWQWVTEFL